MCQYTKPIETNTKFVILMHPKEFKKVKNNTGFFTHLNLKNSEVFIGIDFSNHIQINEIIASHESYILFPSPHALDISKNAALKSSLKPKAIFIIDSTWACTKKIFTLSKNLNTLPHISFTTSRVSAYEIKEQPQGNYLSTIESTLVVLEFLNTLSIEEIDEDELSGFLTPFFRMIEYQKSLISNPLSNSVRYKRHS